MALRAGNRLHASLQDIPYELLLEILGALEWYDVLQVGRVGHPLTVSLELPLTYI